MSEGKNPGLAAKAAAEYQASMAAEKAKVKKEPNRFRRLLKWAWLGIRWPFKWLWMAAHDWRIIAIFAFWFALVSGSVWVWYVLAFAFNGTAFSAWCLGIGSAVWGFWLMPFTPFTLLCISLTIGTKAVLDRVRARKGRG